MLLPDAPPRKQRTHISGAVSLFADTSCRSKSIDVGLVSAANCWLDDEDIGAEVVIGKPATFVPSTSALKLVTMTKISILWWRNGCS
ncbi:unnamed protein product [Leptidea sinapis]|uniref:Uncharacterized protein n=1 Tax=Leptidea sinapis TaxID=189913 RepID=A0A5E4Q1E5_9NEOP|nr:unnamed protein product [Leptidea sinapis]